MIASAVARAPIAPIAPLPAAEAPPAAHPFAELLKQNRDAAAQVPNHDTPPAPAGGAAGRPVATPPQPDAASALPSSPLETTPAEAPAADACATADGPASAADAAPVEASHPHDGASKLRTRASTAAPPASATRDDESREQRAVREDRRLAPAAHRSSAAQDTTGSAPRAPAIDPAAAAPSGDGAPGDDRAGPDRTRVAVDLRATVTADSPARIDADPARSPADARFSDALAGAGPGSTLGATPAGSASPLPASPLPATAAAMPPTASAASASPDAPVAASVATRVDAADFAHAFGVQVSVLVSGGVQRAELHLNPAELGPVSVHLTLEGTQATVDFGAEHAVTRHAIEAGLPELASTLRDAGFTLAGGGVSSHAGGREDKARAGGEAAPAPASDEPRMQALDAGPATRRLMRAGGVDLYA